MPLLMKPDTVEAPKSFLAVPTALMLVFGYCDLLCFVK